MPGVGSSLSGELLRRIEFVVGSGDVSSGSWNGYFSKWTSEEYYRLSVDVCDVCFSAFRLLFSLFADCLIDSQEGLLSLVSRALQTHLSHRSLEEEAKMCHSRLTTSLGNVGILTGPPFFAAMAEYMNGTNQLAIQGVDYPADIAGFLAGGSPIGTAVMCVPAVPFLFHATHRFRAKLINHTLAVCPNTPLLLSGYSQGAQLVHQAAASLPANTTAKISSVVLFGDPKNGTAIQGIAADRVLTICHSGRLPYYESVLEGALNDLTGDDICKGGDDIGISHLNYSLDAGTAAMFALGSAGAKLGITSQRMRPAGGGLG